jgi:hypothetical protein
MLNTNPDFDKLSIVGMCQSSIDRIAARLDGLVSLPGAKAAETLPKSNVTEDRQTS